jgi:hypothetical protein
MTSKRQSCLNLDPCLCVTSLLNTIEAVLILTREYRLHSLVDGLSRLIVTIIQAKAQLKFRLIDQPKLSRTDLKIHVKRLIKGEISV